MRGTRRCAEDLVAALVFLRFLGSGLAPALLRVCKTGSSQLLTSVALWYDETRHRYSDRPHCFPTMSKKVCRTGYRTGCKMTYSRDSEGRILGNPLRRRVNALLLVLCI